MAIEKSRKLYTTRGNSIPLAMTAFAKWWKDLEPRHKTIIILGLFFIFIGLLDLIRLSLLFWANDFFIMFGGVVFIVVGLTYALRSENEQ